MAFDEYEIAMTRKLEIAEWHLAELRDLLPADPDENGLPPIPVQAHFEAAGRALASIPDQLASGISSLLRPHFPCLPKEDRAYLHEIVKCLPSAWALTVRLLETTSDPRYLLFRGWRNRATHRFDEKESRGGFWHVEIKGNSTRINTEITRYLDCMIEFVRPLANEARTLKHLADGVIRDLRSATAR